MHVIGRVALAWAKSRSDDAEARLSLVDHGIDVAAVAEALLHLPTIRARLGALAERPLSYADIARLCVFVGFHDAGKVNHGFQAKLAGKKPDAGHIGSLWAILGRTHSVEADRRIRRDVRKVLLASRWRSWCADRDAERDLWGVILAHHGNLIDAVRPEPLLWRPRNGYDPLAALQTMAEIVAGMFPDAFVDDDHEPLPNQTRFQHAFAGLVTLADWLGSDESVFRFPSDGAPSGVETDPLVA